MKVTPLMILTLLSIGTVMGITICSILNHGKDDIDG